MDWIWILTGGHFWMLPVYMTIIMTAIAYFYLLAIVHIFGTDQYGEH